MECAPEQIIKSLLFIADGVPVLVIACGTAKVDQRKIAAHLGLANKRVKLAPADFVLERAGYAVGGMPPFGHREKFRTLIDPAVAAQKEIYGGGGDERTLLKIATEELRRVTNGEVAEVSDNGGK
jgi:prolyl-tRNA editing enzyme YbaK/EbsC (Cys-tRNA(Pro) deacylase)